jgi:hypothetical protein
MLDDIMYSVMRNLTFVFWVVVSCKVTSQVVFWITGDAVAVWH